MKDLTGKVALVTGGGKGVGKEIARSLATRGADVVINCFHSYEPAKQAKDEIERETGARVDIVRASVAKKEQVDRLFAQVQHMHGGLDILVNNAASGALTPIADIKIEHFTKALETNLMGSFWCATAAAPLMAARGGGSIVNVSSIGAGLVPDNYLVVGTSKAAVEALTRHLATELAYQQIRVNTASCSLITGEVANLFPRAQELIEVALACTPLGRIATPEDLVGVVTFLTCELSRWVTGQVILADGGVSMANAMLSPPRRNAMPFLPPHLTPEKITPEVIAPETIAPETIAPALESESQPEPQPAPESESQPEPQPEPAGDPRRSPEESDDPIVVVGMGLAVPGANSPQEYWRQMQDGAQRFVAAPADRWHEDSFCDADPSAPDKAYQPRAGFITDFVPDPDLAAEIAAGSVGDEHTTLWLRHSLHQALRGVARTESDRVTLTVGYTADGSQHLEEATVLAGTVHRLQDTVDAQSDSVIAGYRRAVDPYLRRGNGDPAALMPHDVARHAMAGLLPSDTRVFVVDTACSSSLYAIDMGMNTLREGESDIAVCGGAFALAPRGAVLFSKLHGLSVRGEVRSLDESADGVLFSDGAGIVVLKRLSRATADGDPILGVVRSVGSSSDGRGKAIYAPSSEGQRRAVERAFSAPGTVPEDLDWVVAHATGTPAGDVAEFTTLRTSLPGDRPIQVTSNKSLIGHTGWAAGVVSVIETILALQNSTIPRQHRFVQAPAAFRLGEGNLRIPREAVPWVARPGHPRTASVSGFGFGGTNAHLVLEEFVGQSRPPASSAHRHERIAVVGWSACVPGLDRAGVRAWLTGAAPGPAASFGAHYPLPDFRQTRIPPATMRILDRCQLMLLDCMHQLQSGLGPLIETHRETTGVLAGHLGPTRNGMLYALRCYLEPLRELLDRAGPDVEPELNKAYDRMAEEVRALIPESNENSFPGMMPNVIPARVANAYDLHGLTMTVDTGFAAMLSASATAAQYLRSGTLDVALVAGVNGNSTPEVASLLADRLPAGTEIGEAGVMLALVRESTARQNDLPVLAYLSDYRVGDGQPADGAATVAVGPGSGNARTYLGADGAVAVLHALLGDAADTTVVCREPSGRSAQPTISLRVRKPSPPPHADAPTERGEPVPTAAIAAEPIAAPGYEAGGPELRRHVVTWRARPIDAVRPTTPFLPPRTLVITDNPTLLDGLAGLDSAVVLSTNPIHDAGPTRVHVSELTAPAVGTTLARLPWRPAHLRLITDLSATAPVESPAAPGDGVLALHDLLFLALQAGLADYARAGSSVLLSLLGGARGGYPHPYSGLFTGLLKAARFELPEALLCAVLTTATHAPTGIAQLVAETAARRLLPVALYGGSADGGSADGGSTRRVPWVQEAIATPARPALHRDSVVFAVGGSRGIGAEALKAIARECHSTIYVVGSNALGDAEPGAEDKQSYVRDLTRRRPEMSVAEASRAYARLRDARAARANLDEMARHNDGRVTYLQCDVRDRAAVEAVVGKVLGEHGRVDLLLNVAGINRSGFIGGKKLDDFRAVRDLKVLAYRNLKAAFGDTAPGLWCNFSSLVGFRGQPGEVDYAAANDFLASAASYSAGWCGQAEFAIGWNLWRDVGLGADPLMRSLLGRRFRFTPMSSSTGVGHFMRELAQAPRDPFMMLMGDGEMAELGLRREQVESAGPETAAADTAASDAAPAVVSGRPYFLDGPVSRTATGLTLRRTFSAESDPYLRDHLVSGLPTLPGTFVAELAAEAAADLVPDQVVIGLHDLRLHAFLRIPPGREVTRTVTARILDRAAHRTRVAVRVSTVVAVAGRAPVDRPQYEVVVHLADGYPQAPRWSDWNPDQDLEAVPDPYHQPNPAVRLSGPFDVTTGTCLHRRGRRAQFTASTGSDDPVFGRFVLPALLLDGLLRVGALDDAGSGYRCLAAPTRIQRIELYAPGNDARWAREHSPIRLYSMPAPPGRPVPADGNRGIAVSRGAVLARIENVRSAAMGFVHSQTGRFCTPAEFSALAPAGVASSSSR